ncbi:MAG: hypothetical protein PHI12_11360 [Dehalococcoidales bacterium]|nr:hypothetical protein [Dehalococcoidales bacterium]
MDKLIKKNRSYSWRVFKPGMKGTRAERRRAWRADNKKNKTGLI